MTRRNTKKLMLNRETVRNLQDTELTRVVGGLGQWQRRDAPVDPRITTGLACEPCVSTSGTGGNGFAELDLNHEAQNMGVSSNC